MPRGAWTAKDERQYEAILKSCRKGGRKKKSCQRIAAATVNKFRASQGRTKSNKSCQCPKGYRRLKSRPGYCWKPGVKRHRKLVCRPAFKRLSASQYRKLNWFQRALLQGRGRIIVF